EQKSDLFVLWRLGIPPYLGLQTSQVPLRFFRPWRPVVDAEVLAPGDGSGAVESQPLQRNRAIPRGRGSLRQLPGPLSCLHGFAGGYLRASRLGVRNGG